MKRLLLLILFVVITSGILIWIAQYDKSYFLLVLGNTSIEINLWLAVALAVLLVAIVWLSVVAITFLLSRTQRFHQRLFSRSEERLQKRTNDGLVAFLCGDWSLAYKHLTRTAKHLSTPFINYLVAARCAYKIGDVDKAMVHLNQAAQCRDDDSLVVGLMRVKMYIETTQYQRALDALHAIDTLYPNNHNLLALKKDVYLATEDWSALKTLLPVLHKQEIATLEERYYLEQRLCLETVKENIEKNHSLDNKQRAQLLERCVNNLPAHFQKDQTILTLFIDTLIALDAHDNAGKILAKNINREWNDTWVYQYGLLQFSDAVTALTQAETWTKQQPNNATLYLTLGRLCLQNKQWGRAKDFLQDSIAKQALAEAYAELGRLQEYLGETIASQSSYRQGVLHASDRLLPITFLGK